MKVSVVYATPAHQVMRRLEIPEHSTLLDAVRSSGVLEEFAELRQASEHRFGVFGRPCRADARLRDGDQVEIYRPLKLSPMEARRMRARKPKR